jgi:hypothetical protein
MFRAISTSDLQPGALASVRLYLLFLLFLLFPHPDGRDKETKGTRDGPGDLDHFRHSAAYPSSARSKPSPDASRTVGCARCCPPCRSCNRSDTDREIRAGFDRQASATKQRLLPWSLPILMCKAVFFFGLVPPKSHAVMDPIPCFDRLRNLTPGLPPSSLAV